MLASLVAHNKFLINPEKFVSFLSVQPPLPTHLRIMILGSPLSGKSTQAKMISTALGIPLLDMDAEVENRYQVGEFSYCIFQAKFEEFGLKNAVRKFANYLFTLS